jgi:LacI family transcriptional regulator
LVLFDRISTKLKVPTVTLNDFNAGFLAAQHLIDQGYKKIAFITTVQPIKTFTDRLEGYREAMKINQLPIDADHIVFGGLSIKDGKYGAAKLLSAKTIPEAIITADDYTALGVLKQLKEVNEIPPKIGLIGFSNEAFSAYISPALSTVDQHPNLMGRGCAELFLQMIKKNHPYDDICHLVLEPTIIKRQSSNL